MKEARSVKFCEEKKGKKLLSIQLNNNDYKDFYPIQVYKENKIGKLNQENIKVILNDTINQTNDENLVNVDLNEENTENFITIEEVEEENLPPQNESQFPIRGRKRRETKETLEERHKRHLEEQEEKLQREGVRRSNRIKENKGGKSNFK